VGTIDRRAFLRRSVAGAALAALPLRSAVANDLTVAALYVGRKDDHGLGQSHAEGLAALRSLTGVRLIEVERVPETPTAEQVVERLIDSERAGLVLLTSYDYFDPHMLNLCAKYPNVQFRHCGDLWRAGRHPVNAGSYFGFIDECQYLCGIVAGHTTKTGKLGFIGSEAIPPVLRNINAFTLGARAARADATVQVYFTGDWYLPNREAEIAGRYAGQGIDVLACDVYSPKRIVEAAEQRGVFVCGYHVDQRALAPKGFLAGAEWVWEKPYVELATSARDGKPLPNILRRGLKSGFVRFRGYGPGVGDAARRHAEDAKAKLIDGSLPPFRGPLADNKGNRVIQANRAYASDDPWLDGMNWLVEGALGSTK
jgi:simple sugar transport system substrate-binding protein